MVKIIRFALFLIIASSSFATSWYIDNQANGNNNGTSWENAWENFSSINWSLINPGDTIFLSGGTNSKTNYGTLTIGASGTASVPIIVTKGTDTNHNGKVVFDGQLSTYSGLIIENQHDVIIQDLHLQDYIGSGAVLVVEVSYNITISGLNIRTAGHGGIHISGWTPSLVTNQLYDIVVKYNKITTLSNTTRQTDGIYAQYCQDIFFHDNNIVISNTNIQPHCDGIQLYVVKNATLNNNYIEQIAQGGIVPNQGIWTSTCSGTFTLFNNIIYTPNFTGWGNTFGYLENGNNVALRIYNNTFIGGDNANVVTIDDPDAIIKNNIFISDINGRGVYLGNNLTNNSNLNYNFYGFRNSWGALVFLGSQGNSSLGQLHTAGAEINGIDGIGYQGPLFVNESARDFSPHPNAPFIDKGVDLGSQYNRDMKRRLRPQGSGWDMGALEFIGETITKPGKPSGDINPMQGDSYTYSTNGSSSSLGHQIEYSFDWGDGQNSPWSTSLNDSHVWTVPGDKNIVVNARCSEHTNITNESDILTVTVNVLEPPTSPSNLRIKE